MFDKSYCDCVGDINNDTISKISSTTQGTRDDRARVPSRHSGKCSSRHREEPLARDHNPNTRGPTQSQSTCAVVGGASCQTKRQADMKQRQQANEPRDELSSSTQRSSQAQSINLSHRHSSPLTDPATNSWVGENPGAVGTLESLEHIQRGIVQVSYYSQLSGLHQCSVVRTTHTRGLCHCSTMTTKSATLMVALCTTLHDTQSLTSARERPTHHRNRVRHRAMVGFNSILCRAFRSLGPFVVFHSPATPPTPHSHSHSTRPHHRPVARQSRSSRRGVPRDVCPR